jgi:glycosyltransferase involved in cell wall biosynthesis
MKISVVIPNYNDIRIERALDSVFAQTYKNFETIVVDGMSTNALVPAIYKKFAIDRLICEKDRGIFDALNKGIRQATGDVIYLMGADDCLSESTVFEQIRHAFDDKPSLDGVCVGCEFVNAKGQVLRTWYPRSVSTHKIKKGIYPPHFSLFLRKELYQLVGQFKFEETKNVATDIVWLLDLALLGPALQIEVIHDVHLKMEYGGASTGSVRSIIRQFLVVHRYAKQKRLTWWLLHSFVRSASKIFQFKKIRF